MTEFGFVVLPDSPAAAAIRGLVPWRRARIVPHVSGRPWLVGRWQFDEATVVSAGPTRLAVIGICPVTADRLRELAARLRTVADVDALARALPGSAYLVAAVDGQVRVQGSLTGLRAVFHSRVRGVPVAADQAAVLAAMTGAAVDERALAVRVACGALLPAPVAERPLWQGVAALPPDHCLVLDRERAQARRWWRPPVPDGSLADGAAAVRALLTAALDGRAPGHGRLSADLSGGMDSTSLSFLAARHTPGLLTFRWSEADAGNDDRVFATHAMETLADAEHVVVEPETLPPLYADPHRAGWTEAPGLFARTDARQYHIASLLARHGSRRHLAGHGGDELFAGMHAYLHRLAFRHPVTAVRHVRAYRALKRWPLRETLGGLLRPGTVAGWWREQADQLTAPYPTLRRPVLGWGLAPLRAAPWISPAGIDLARDALRDAAGHAQPLAEDPAQHQVLLVARTNSCQYRGLARTYATAGVQLDLPYLDDRVLEAVLAVRPRDRCGPFRYKPVLAEAMRDIVPERVLGRSTKGTFDEDARLGLRANRAAILGMFTDSALAARGLIEPGALRTGLAAPQADTRVHQHLEALISCEAWLRAATVPGRSDAPAAAP